MVLLLEPADQPVGLFSQRYLHGVWIPTGFIIAAVAAIKPAYSPYAAVVGLLIIAWRFQEMKPKAILHKTLFQGFRHVHKNTLSPNTAIYRFALPTKNHILGLPIGQHISVQAEIDGEKVMRSYTPISSDENKGYFDLLVKSYPTGRISKHFGELKLNDFLKIKGPKGAMVYEPNMVRHFGMIAGGTGITPMLQIIRAISRNRPANGGTDTTEVDLIFANVNPEDILLKEDLDKISKEDPGFRVHYVLNNPPEGWTGGSGFVTPEMIKDKLPAAAKDIKILLCGPPPMINAMKKATESLGYETASKVSKLHDQVFCF